MQSVRQLEQKDVEMASVKQQLDDAERQHNVQLMRLQIEVGLTTSHSVYVSFTARRTCHIDSVSKCVVVALCRTRKR